MAKSALERTRIAAPYYHPLPLFIFPEPDSAGALEAQAGNADALPARPSPNAHPATPPLLPPLCRIGTGSIEIGRGRKWEGSRLLWLRWGSK